MVVSGFVISGGNVVSETVVNSNIDMENKKKHYLLYFILPCHSKTLEKREEDLFSNFRKNNIP
jgi:hypothetical protein